MKLKKALGITEFNSPWQKTLLNLEYTHQVIQQRLSDLYGQFNISKQQFITLKTIASFEHNEPGITEIKHAIPDKNADTSRMIARLCQKGYLQKSIRKNDRRSAAISITETGKSVLELVEKKQSQIESVMFNLSKKDCKELNGLLDKLRG